MNRVVRLVEAEKEIDLVPDREDQQPTLQDVTGLNPEHLRMAEALLFAAGEPLDAKALASSLPEGADVPALLTELQAIYEKRGVTLVCVAEKWQFRTAPDLSESLAELRVEERRLSRSAMETLAVIAYHQPITRAGVSEILGREVSRDVIGALRDKNMIAAGPRSPTAGAPFTYVTTKGFLEHFGLDTLRDIPGLDELEGAGLLGQADKSVGGSPITGESEGERGPAPE